MMTTDPAETLRRRWSDGQRPDLLTFLAEIGPLSAAQLAQVVRVDQLCRWERVDPFATTCPPAASAPGETLWVETYFKQFPQLNDEAELAVDLIVNEFLIREKLGQTPSPGEYLQRFPDHAGVLKGRFEPNRAPVSEEAPAGSTFHPARRTEANVRPIVGSSSLPEQFGRYRIGKRLGQGGMGTVYLATDTQLDRQVALKVPTFVGDDAAEIIARFQREARIAGTFHHPNLCPVYDVGEIDGIKFLTMPLLAGETMSSWLKRIGPLPCAAACRLAILIARAVQVAHQAGVLHRDLKPANIMVREGVDARGPDPVVMDFGLARRSGGRDPQLTGTGAMLGTATYMPPEQVSGDDAQLGPPADVYSLGVILYEMLTGRTPFRGELHVVLRAVLAEAPPAFEQFRPDVPADLQAVCLKALAKDPADRYASMADFAAALEAVRLDAPAPSVEQAPHAPTIASTPTHETAPRGKDQRPRRTRGILVGGILAGVIAVSVLLWIVLFPPRADLPPDNSKPAPPSPIVAANDKLEKPKIEPKKEEVLKTPNVEPKKEEVPKTPNVEPKKEEVLKTPAILKGHTAPVRALAFNPKDPQQLVSGGDDGVLRVWQVASGKHQILKGNPGPVLAVAISPDGKQVASAGGDTDKLLWDVLLWDLAGARIKTRLKGHFYLVSGAAFSRDGKILATAAGDNTVRLWDTQGNEDQEGKKLEGHTVWVRAVAFNHQANQLVSGGDDETVRLWNLADGKSTGWKGHDRPVLTVAFSPDGRSVASAGGDKRIKLWQTATGRNTATLQGHKGSIHALAFHPDGTQLVSASADGTLMLWDLAKGKHVASFEGHVGAVNAVAFHPDGRTFASAGSDHSVRLWNVSAPTSRPKDDE